MLSRVFALVPFVLLAAAAAPQCITGQPNCCNKVVQPSDPVVATTLKSINLFGLLGSVLANVDAVVGLTCTGNGADCSQTPLCCEKNLNDGLIAVGCTPVKVL